MEIFQYRVGACERHIYCVMRWDRPNSNSGSANTNTGTDLGTNCYTDSCAYRNTSLAPYKYAPTNHSDPF